MVRLLSQRLNPPKNRYPSLGATVQLPSSNRGFVALYGLYQPIWATL